MKKHILFVSLGLVVLVAVALQVVATRANRSVTPVPRPAEVLPQKIAGWRIQDRPIADTAEMRRAVGELLNYDEAVLRSYTRAGKTLDVYVACWRAGKMSPRLIAGHTPDVCWVAAGCTLRSSERRSLAPAQALGAGEYREFQMPDKRTQYVLFWHYAGPRAITYERTGTPPWWAVFTDLARDGLGQRQPQVFIRLSSTDPFVVWEKDPALAEITAALARLLIDEKEGRGQIKEVRSQ